MLILCGGKVYFSYQHENTHKTLTERVSRLGFSQISSS